MRPKQDFFADSLTEAIITDLAKVRALRVISRTSVMRYKGANRPLPEIARELGASAVVEGSVVRVGDRVRVTAQLIDATTDEHLWAESYERDLKDVLAVQDEVARRSPRADRRREFAPRISYRPDRVVRKTFFEPPRLRRLARLRARSTEGEGDHAGRVAEVVDRAPLVGLMRELEHARAVGHAVLDPGQAGEVLLVVGAGAGHERGLPAPHLGDRAPERGGDRRARGRLDGMDDHPVAQLVGEPGRAARRLLEKRRALLRGASSKPSSIRKRRSKMARQRSATHGDWTACPAWPPSIALTLSVARAAPGGTTGMPVTRDARAGRRRSRNASSTAPMPSIALTPRKGMLPWAMRPCVSTSNQ